METDNQSFEREFMQKVRGGAVADGAVVNAGGERRKLDWKVLGALLVGAVVLVGWIVWMIVGQGGNREDMIVAGMWVCDDKSTVEVFEDGRMLWDTAVGRYEGKYDIGSARVVFGSNGSMTGVISEGALQISDPMLWVDIDDGKISCEREE